MAMEMLIHYAYMLDMTLNKGNAKDVLSAANMLEILPVKDAATRYLECHIDASNFLDLLVFAKNHDCHSLQSKTKAFQALPASARHLFQCCCPR